MAYGIFHRARSDRPVAGGDATGAILVGEYEKEGDRVAWQVLEVNADTDAVAEALPDTPRVRGGVRPMCRYAGVHRRRDSAPITAEFMSAWSCSNFHDVTWG